MDTQASIHIDSALQMPQQRSIIHPQSALLAISNHDAILHEAGIKNGSF